MYDLAWLLAQQRAQQSLKYLYFGGHTPKQANKMDASCLSQWYPAPFTVQDITYPTAEHYMMAQKAKLFGDDEVWQHILASAHPKQAKDWGRQVKGFEQDVWEAQCWDIVVAGNQAKFSQNNELKDFLCKTGKRVLVEASPVDRIWGVGLSRDDWRILQPERWRGRNLLGFALMAVRDALLAR